MKHKTDKWREYERIKAALRCQNLTPDEYKRRLQVIAKRLRI